MDTPENNDQPEPLSMNTSPRVKKRPWSVTLLALLVLIITVVNLIRFVLSIKDWAFLSSHSAVSPLYLALTGLVWSVAGGILLWGLLSAKTWALKLMQAVGLSYALYYWLDQIFLKDHPFSENAGLISSVLTNNWLFAAIVTLLLLGFMEWVVNRGKVKDYFG
jgi:hypothetical protein